MNSNFSGIRVKVGGNGGKCYILAMFSDTDLRRPRQVSNNFETHSSSVLKIFIQDVSGGIINILGGGSMDYSE